LFAGCEMKINYMHLFKWMQKNKITFGTLAENAKPEKISYQTVSKRLQNGEQLPSTVILIWQQKFKWTDYERDLFCLNGQAGQQSKPLGEFTTDEILQEIGRRMTA